uniref:Carboxylesterase type B domain-containing protein n=1 Tax=Panagrolaimus davidi TaxID=227884 RepID=A0A914PTH9_9BILA
MSGSSLAIWGHNEHVIESSEYVLNKLCPKFNGTEAVNCLKTKSQDEILNTLRFKMPTIIRRDDPNIVDFGPRLGGAKDLIPNGDLQTAIKQAPKRPHLIGFNSLDMLAFAIPNPYIPPTLKAEIPIPKLSSLLLFDKKYFSTIVKKVFGKTSTFGETNATKISESIIDYYAENVAANYTITGWIQAYLQCLSDIDFYVPAIREAKYKAAAGWSNIYMYRYSYANPLIQLVLDPRIKGSPHAFDLFNFFDNVLGIPEPPPTLIDLKVRKNFVDLFIDFVKGNDMEISPVTENQAPFIDVNVRNLISPDFAPKTVQFWDDLGKEFGFDWPSGDIIN